MTDETAAGQPAEDETAEPQIEDGMTPGDDDGPDDATDETPTVDDDDDGAA